jgi:hypothetical protein
VDATNETHESEGLRRPLMLASKSPVLPYSVENPTKTKLRTNRRRTCIILKAKVKMLTCSWVISRDPTTALMINYIFLAYCIINMWWGTDGYNQPLK